MLNCIADVGFVLNCFTFKNVIISRDLFYLVHRIIHNLIFSFLSAYSLH
uniref:Uncharacterized protein n=1 Tax=Arundo donax TaxID=35708 RepID=A0A0A9C2K8_ARUDO